MYIHEHALQAVYPENGEFPDELRASPRTLKGARPALVTQEYITNGEMEKAIDNANGRPVDHHCTRFIERAR